MKNISTVIFEDIRGMANALVTLQGDARAMQINGYADIANPVVYVIGPDGTQYSRAILRQETLTDGSRVYHVELSA